MPAVSFDLPTLEHSRFHSTVWSALLRLHLRVGVLILSDQHLESKGIDPCTKDFEVPNLAISCPAHEGGGPTTMTSTHIESIFDSFLAVEKHLVAARP